MISAKKLVGTHDILFITLDSLRYDVAQTTLNQGMTPNLQRWLPNQSWEMRHTPSTFTYGAHQSFFSGFFPTPITPGIHPRPFAVQFPGSQTISEDTYVFETPDIVSGFSSIGYHTLCIGGVGFFNMKSPLGSVLPNLFQEKYWLEEFGVTNSESTRHQVEKATEILARLNSDTRLFFFLNVSALHQPNCIFHPSAKEDSCITQASALSYADRHLGNLFEIMRKRASVFCIVCSDHGTAYGEDHYHGHRIAHPVVWEVPYAEFILPHKDK
jgi:hypothetical protein